MERCACISRERWQGDLRISLRRSSGSITSGGMSGSAQRKIQMIPVAQKNGCIHPGSVNGYTKSSPLHSVMLSPLRTLMSSTAISPQLFASIRLSITTLKKSIKAELFPEPLNLVPNKSQRKNDSGLPGTVCQFLGPGPDLPSSGCPGDRWRSTAECQLARRPSVYAVWCAACRCVTQTCGTKKTRRGQNPGMWPRDWPAEPPWSPEAPLLKCRWSSLIHLLGKTMHVAVSKKGEMCNVSAVWGILYLYGPC